MKKILTILMIQVLLLSFTILNAQPPTPPTPPSSQDLTTQMQQLQQQMQLLQQQLQQLQEKNEMPDSLRKKMIVINDEKINGFDEKGFDSSMENFGAHMKGLDSSMKFFQNNDSMVINMGKMKFKMFDKDANKFSKIEKDEDIVVNHKDSTSHPHKFNVRIFGFRFGWDNYLYKGQFKNPPGYDALELNSGKSIDIGLSIFVTKLNIIKTYLTLNTTLGLDINNYRFNSSSTLIPKIDSVAFKQPTGDQNVTKNKLVTTYLVLPVRLQYESNKNSSKAFRLSAGGRLGYLIGSHTKAIINDQKIKDHDDFNLDVFKYGLEFGIGYGWLNLYFDYDLTPFFSSGVNPPLTPVSVGIALANF